MDKQEIETVIAAWTPMPQPLLIGQETARKLVANVGEWFSCPKGVFLVATYIIREEVTCNDSDLQKINRGW